MKTRASAVGIKECVEDTAMMSSTCTDRIFFFPLIPATSLSFTLSFMHVPTLVPSAVRSTDSSQSARDSFIIS